MALVIAAISTSAYADECADIQLLARLAGENFESIRSGPMVNERSKATRRLPGFEDCEIVLSRDRRSLECRSSFFDTEQQAEGKVRTIQDMLARCPQWRQAPSVKGGLGFVDAAAGVALVIKSEKALNLDIVREQPVQDLDFRRAERHRVRVVMSASQAERSAELNPKAESDNKPKSAPDDKPKGNAGLCEALKKVIVLAPERFASIKSKTQSYGWSTTFRLPGMSSCFVGEVDGRHFFTCSNRREQEDQARQQYAELARAVQDCLQSDGSEEQRRQRLTKEFDAPNGALVEVILAPPSNTRSDWRISLDVNEP